MISQFAMNIQRRSLVAALVLVAALAQSSQAQFFGNRGAVGGVKVDVDGVLSNPEVTELQELRQAWQAGLQQVPSDLQQPAALRFVSLKQLEASAAQAQQDGKPLPDAVRFLAGLTRVQYVLVYPDQNDIVLAGPAEGWRVDALGNVVGATSGQPVLLLDDLMVALRAAEQANMNGISCSIDPTPAGMERLKQAMTTVERGAAPSDVAKMQEQAVGLQTIRVTGVPETSHFARTLVAADFRMKRLGMGFEQSPVAGMPSFLEMYTGRSAGLQNMMPRWWMAPHYEPIRRDADGLVWELRGQGVKCLTEQDLMTANGGRQHTGQGDAVASKWANKFTDKFTELAHKDSTFGQLRNVMDLSVIAALLAKEGLVDFVGLQMPMLTGGVALEEYPAPRSVASQASLVQKRGNWIISVSGGVQIYPWQVADRVEESKELATARPERDAASSHAWYW